MIVTLISCNDRSSNSNGTKVISDTNSFVDNGIFNKPNDSATTVKISAFEIEQFKRKLEMEKIITDKKKVYGNNYNLVKELEILEPGILYEADFAPSAIIRLRNNLKVDFIAIEIVVAYRSDCKVMIKKKMKIKASQTVTVKERFSGVASCNYEAASVTLGDCILSSGEKIDMDPVRVSWRTARVE